MNRPTIYFSVVLVLSLCLAMTSCYRPDRASRYFHYNDMSGIASLDPAFAKNQSVMWAVHQLYSTLVEVDDQLRIIPLLASSWDLSPDRRVYTFHLRRDIYFHDDPSFPGGRGRRLTAADVVFSFRRLLDPRLASPGAWIFTNKVEAGNAFAALDDSTFQLHLLRPYSPMLGILSMQYCSIVPKEAVERYGPDFRRHPVGTGPFAFTSWEEGQDLLMHRNPRYFERDSSGRPLPYLDGIHISFFDSKATEFLLFRQGRLDFINDIDASFKDEVLTKAGQLRPSWAGKIVLRTHPYLNIEYLGFLVDSTNPLLAHSPVRLRYFRQAINYGFDRQKMMLYLRNSLGTPAQSGFLPAGLPSFDSASVKGYHYDPAKSRQLLAQAGFPEGKGLPTTTLYTIANYADMANFIAQQLGEIGIPIQVEVVQKSLLLQLTATSQALFFRGSWIADYPDGENYLSVFYSRNPAPPNYTRYANPAFDAVFEEALEENNDSLRYLLYRKADQLVMDDAPVVPLWYDEVVWLCQPGLAGFRPNALNLLELRRTRLEHP